MARTGSYSYIKTGMYGLRPSLSSTVTTSSDFFSADFIAKLEAGQTFSLIFNPSFDPIWEGTLRETSIVIMRLGDI